MTTTLHDDRLLAERIAADDLCTAVDAARDQLAAALEALDALPVGGDDGQLDPQDRADAMHELGEARRALRHLARIATSHANALDDLAGEV